MGGKKKLEEVEGAFTPVCERLTWGDALAANAKLEVKYTCTSLALGP